MLRPPAYTGDDPYLFVAYSHHDEDTVAQEITWLQGEGFNVAYDEGISPGSSWSDAIAERIQHCSCFLYFVSPDSVVSEYCRQELNFAIEENRKVLAVHLEATQLPPGVRLSLNNRQAILKHTLSQETYRRKLHGSLAGEQIIPSPPVAAAHHHLSISVIPDGENQETTGLVSALVRYLSWQGGIFRVRAQAPRADYLVHAGIRAGTVSTIRWEVVHSSDGDVVWSDQRQESGESLSLKQDHLAETIGEGILELVSEYERSRLADRPLNELGFAELMLRSDQLNYADRQQVANRMTALERARTLEPDSALPSAGLASLLSWQIINGLSGDPAADRARLLDEARRALRLSANDPAVLLSIGTTYSRIGRYDQGLNLIRRACQRAPTAAARDQLARSLCFAGQPEEAIDLLRENLETLPAGLSFPHVRLAVALTQAGELEQALNHSTLSVLNFPEDYYGWFVHANLLAHLDRGAEALEALHEGQRLLPGLRIQSVIDNTISTYGRTDAQREWLTAGLVRLAALNQETDSP